MLGEEGKDYLDMTRGTCLFHCWSSAWRQQQQEISKVINLTVLVEGHNDGVIVGRLEWLFQVEL